MNEDQKTRLLRSFAIPAATLLLIGVLLFLLSRILLTVSVDLAPFIALAVALIVFLGAALIALRPRIDGRQAAGLAGVLFVAVAAGGVASWFVGEREIEPETPEAVVQIAALNLEFDKDTLNVPAGEAFVIEFDNQENVPHNVAIYASDAAEEPLFVGAVFSGPQAMEYEVDALEPGEYFFRCDVHPQQMTGTLIAAEFPEGGEPNARTISAENIQFNVTELEFPAGQEVSLTFENLEPVPHNVSIYTDETASEVIFSGDILNSVGTITYEFTTPPPGEYYFQCDVHPQQMFGTVIIE